MVMTQTPGSVLADGWTTTREAARTIGMERNAFRVWLDRHEEVTRSFVGRNMVVRIDEVIQARKGDKVYAPRSK